MQWFLGNTSLSPELRPSSLMSQRARVEKRLSLIQVDSIWSESYIFLRLSPERKPPPPSSKSGKKKGVGFRYVLAKSGFSLVLNRAYPDPPPSSKSAKKKGFPLGTWVMSVSCEDQILRTIVLILKIINGMPFWFGHFLCLPGEILRCNWYGIGLVISSMNQSMQELVSRVEGCSCPS